MKKYTEEDLAKFERDEDGFLICPSGDYTEIRSFGAGCSFGAWCSFGAGCRFGEGCRFGAWCRFGERCRFGEGCSFGKRCSFENGHKAKDDVYPLMSFGGFGSCYRTTYAFNCEDGIIIRCGCFCGSVAEFRKKVKETHGDSQLAKEYLMIADLIEMKWKNR